MRIAFFGTSAFAVPALESLVNAGHQIVACITQPDKPQGRGLRVQPSPVKQAATALGLPMRQPETLEALPRLQSGLDADLYVVVSYGNLLPGWLLAQPRHGVVSIHPSLLPKLRGAAPIPRAILSGETATGITIFRLVEQMDAGPIARQRQLAIDADETAVTLGQRLAVAGAAELLAVLKDMEQGAVRWQPQDEAAATLAPKLTKADGVIDWSQSARAIHNRVRAMQPWPGAATTWSGRPLKILQTCVVSEAGHQGTPGAILGTAAHRIEVAAGSGVVGIMRLQPAAKPPMDAQAFLTGHRASVGQRFE